MSTDVFTTQVLHRALELKEQGMSWSRISARLGVSDEGLKRRLIPGWAGRRAEQIRDARAVRDGFAIRRRDTTKGRGQAGIRIPEAEVEAAMRTVPPDTRSLHARWMGDPLPGRSALDRLRAEQAPTRKPYSPVRASSTYYHRGFLGVENLERAQR